MEQGECQSWKSLQLLAFILTDTPQPLSTRTTRKRKIHFVKTFGALCIKKRRRLPANSRLPELA
jgi:hypothetical protein